MVSKTTLLHFCDHSFLLSVKISKQKYQVKIIMSAVYRFTLTSTFVCFLMLFLLFVCLFVWFLSLLLLVFLFFFLVCFVIVFFFFALFCFCFYFSFLGSCFLEFDLFCFLFCFGCLGHSYNSNFDMRKPDRAVIIFFNVFYICTFSYSVMNIG